MCDTDTKEISHRFNEFFVNIDSKLAHTIPSTNAQNIFTSYLKNKSLSTFNLKPVTEDIVIQLSRILIQIEVHVMDQLKQFY